MDWMGKLQTGKKDGWTINGSKTNWQPVMSHVPWVILKLMLFNILISRLVRGQNISSLSQCETSDWDGCLIHWMAGLPFRKTLTSSRKTPTETQEFIKDK